MATHSHCCVCVCIFLWDKHTHNNIPRDAMIKREYKAYIGMGAINISNDVFVLLYFLLCMMNTISQDWEKKSYRYAFGTVLWCTVDICFICALYANTYIIRMYIQTSCTYVCTHWQLFILREQTKSKPEIIVRYAQRILWFRWAAATPK